MLLAKRLVFRIGRRGAFLLFLSMVELTYAVSLLFPTDDSRQTVTFRYIVEVLPPWVWAVLWGGSGIVCLVFAFRKWDAPGYMAAMFLMTFWALIFLLGWMFAGVERGYLSAAIWGAFGAVTWLIGGWPEPAREADEP